MGYLENLSNEELVVKVLLAVKKLKFRQIDGLTNKEILDRYFPSEQFTDEQINYIINNI